MGKLGGLLLLACAVWLPAAAHAEAIAHEITISVSVWLEPAPPSATRAANLAEACTADLADSAADSAPLACEDGSGRVVRSGTPRSLRYASVP